MRVGTWERRGARGAGASGAGAEDDSDRGWGEERKREPDAGSDTGPVVQSAACLVALVRLSGLSPTERGPRARSSSLGPRAIGLSIGLMNPRPNNHVWLQTMADC